MHKNRRRYKIFTFCAFEINEGNDVNAKLAKQWRAIFSSLKTCVPPAFLDVELVEMRLMFNMVKLG